MSRTTARARADGGPALGLFKGCWHLKRRIDHADGTHAEAEGQARFAPDDSGLVMVERGVLRMDGATAMRFDRRYLWRSDENGGIVVLFGDGRPFHEFGVGRVNARHDCPPDRYDVSYDLSRLPESWGSVWRVIGPRKNYRMTTRYDRVERPLA